MSAILSPRYLVAFLRMVLALRTASLQVEDFFLAIAVLTVIVGALVCIFLPDSPVKAKRFTDGEKVAALMRVKGNQR